MRQRGVRRFAASLHWILGAVLLLLLVLYAVAIPVMSEARNARVAVTKTQIAAFLVALGRYQSDVGEFPTESQGLQALRINPGVPGWNGPYYPRDVPVDPWGAPYRYRLVSGLPQVVSLGGGSEQGERAIE